MPFTHLTSKAAVYLYSIVAIALIVVVGVVYVANSKIENPVVVITGIIGFGATIITNLFGQLNAAQRSEENVKKIEEQHKEVLGKAEEAATEAKQVKEKAQVVAEVTSEIRQEQKEIKERVDGNLRDVIAETADQVRQTANGSIERAITKTAEEVRRAERDQVITDLLADERFRDLVRFIVQETCNATKD